MKSLCFMFINYRQYILKLKGGKKQFAAPQDKKFILGCCGLSLVCGFNVCLSLLQRKPRGRRIWDSIYGLDGKPTQMSGVKDSFIWQVKEVCCVGAVMVLADGCLSSALRYSWHARPWLVKSCIATLFTVRSLFFFLEHAWKSFSTTGWRDNRNTWCVACA